MRMCALLLLALLVAPSLHAGVYLEEEQKVTGMIGAPTQAMVIKSWYQGDMVKKNLSGAGFSFLINLKKQEVVVLQPAQKAYWMVPAESYQMMTQASLQAFGVVRKPDGTFQVPKNVFKKTGKKKKIGKWQAYEVHVETTLPNNGKVSIWFGRGVGLDQKDFVQTLRGAMASSSPELDGFFKEISALEGYPVLSTASFDYQGQRIVLTQQVKVAEKKTFPKSDFAIPKGFKKIKSPLGAMPGSGQGAVPQPDRQPHR